MHPRKLFVWVGIMAFSLAGGMFTGCAPQSGPTSSGVATEDARSPKPTNAVGLPSEPEITLRVVDEKELAEIISSKKGSVVLVDYWATWCPACLKLMPHTLELARKWKDRGLVVISLSFDDPDDQDRVLEQLEKLDARIENYLAKYGASDESVKAFDITNGALPHYKIYDRSGNLRKVLVSGGPAITPEMIDAAVEELLGEAG